MCFAIRRRMSANPYSNWRSTKGPLYLHECVSPRLLAEELHMNGAAETRIEEHVPARMVVVVIDVDAVAVRFPVAAARNVVGRDDPIGLVVENDVPRARIISPRAFAAGSRT